MYCTCALFSFFCCMLFMKMASVGNCSGLQCFKKGLIYFDISFSWLSMADMKQHNQDHLISCVCVCVCVCVFIGIFLRLCWLFVFIFAMALLYLIHCLHSKRFYTGMLGQINLQKCVCVCACVCVFLCLCLCVSVCVCVCVKHNVSLWKTRYDVRPLSWVRVLVCHWKVGCDQRHVIVLIQY